MGGGFDTRGFKISPVPTLDGIRYPPMRTRRQMGVAEFGLAVLEEGAEPIGPLPNTRIWPFLLNDATVGQRALAASPRLSGPAYIIDLTAHWTVGTATETPVLSLLYSNEDGGQGANIADTVQPTGTHIFDRIVLAAGTLNTYNVPFGWPQRAAQSLNTPFTVPIGYIVREPTFHLKVTLDNQAAGGMEMAGYIRIIENLDPRTFKLF
jgi:hypothetical protein